MYQYHGAYRTKHMSFRRRVDRYYSYQVKANERLEKLFGVACIILDEEAKRKNCDTVLALR